MSEPIHGTVYSQLTVHLRWIRVYCKVHKLLDKIRDKADDRAKKRFLACFRRHRLSKHEFSGDGPQRAVFLVTLMVSRAEDVGLPSSLER